MAALYLDEDVAIRLAPLLIDRGHFVTHNRDDFRLLHDAWLIWSHEWGNTRRHHGILVIGRLRGMTPEGLAELVHILLSNPDTDLENALYDWKPTTGWQRWPR